VEAPVDTFTSGDGGQIGESPEVEPVTVNGKGVDGEGQRAIADRSRRDFGPKGLEHPLNAMVASLWFAQRDRKACVNL
jgi:hypothetical protein